MHLFGDKVENISPRRSISIHLLFIEHHVFPPVWLIILLKGKVKVVPYLALAVGAVIVVIEMHWFLGSIIHSKKVYRCTERGGFFKVTDLR